MQLVKRQPKNMMRRIQSAVSIVSFKFLLHAGACGKVAEHVMLHRIQEANGKSTSHDICAEPSSVQFEYDSRTFQILFIFLQMRLTGNFGNWSNRFAETESCEDE